MEIYYEKTECHRLRYNVRYPAAVQRAYRLRHGRNRRSGGYFPCYKRGNEQQRLRRGRPGRRLPRLHSALQRRRRAQKPDGLEPYGQCDQAPQVVFALGISGGGGISCDFCLRQGPSRPRERRISHEFFPQGGRRDPLPYRFHGQGGADP